MEDLFKMEEPKFDDDLLESLNNSDSTRPDYQNIKNIFLQAKIELTLIVLEYENTNIRPVQKIVINKFKRLYKLCFYNKNINKHMHIKEKKFLYYYYINSHLISPIIANQIDDIFYRVLNKFKLIDPSNYNEDNWYR